ncbi:MAG: hypothetical protein PHY56_07430 [Candidatus Omnitrophica bacterium]|nr:hypothetical protein [Candidatus Omnitrophota bacterium]
MKIKYFIIFVIIGFVAVGFINLAGKVLAQESSIQYPIEELGGCKDKADCKSYCDKEENIEACLDFAEKNKLMSQEEIEIAKNFIETGNKGPGGCTNKDACEQYCNDMSHIDECVAFAEKNNLMSAAELEEAKKIQAAIAKGVKPPACGNKKDCDAYCDDSEHMEECITFAEESGFLAGKELEDAKKMLQAIKKGVKAPPCKGKEACDQYCNKPENMELCMTFAMEAGFMGEEEKVNAQKMLQAIKKGINPPNCNGKEECDKYCSQEEHFEECINFSLAAGFMSEEDAAMAKKTGGKGPGGCTNKEECEAFCNNPDNQQTCFDFSKANGMISEEDLKQMEEGTRMFKESLERAPAEVMDCLNSKIGSDTIEKLKNGTMMPSNDLGEKMRECFEVSMPPQGEGGPGAGGTMPPAGGTTPPEGSQMPPTEGTMPPSGGGQPGPGGCTSQEECQNYCASHPQECQSPQQQTAPMNPMPGGGEGSAPPPMNQTCTGPDCQQAPNQIMIPTICEGENCQSAPAPGSQPPSVQQISPGEIIPPTTQSPAPMEIQQTPSAPAPPPVDQAPQIESSSPPPSSFLDQNSFLGSVVQIFLKLFSY